VAIWNLWQLSRTSETAPSLSAKNALGVAQSRKSDSPSSPSPSQTYLGGVSLADIALLLGEPVSARLPLGAVHLNRGKVYMVEATIPVEFFFPWR